MESATATAIGVLVALLVLVVLTATGKPRKISGSATAVVGFGYGVLMLASLTGAGLDLARAVVVLMLVAAAYPAAVVARRMDLALSGHIRALLSVIVSAALLSLLSHTLSLIGWVYVAAATIALAASAGAIAVLGGDGGTQRVNKWTVWVALVPSWLLAALFFFQFPGVLFNPTLPVSDLPVGLFVAMAVVVVVLALADPLLRHRIGGTEANFPVGGMVLAAVLMAGIMLAALLLFGGSLFVPSVSIFMIFTYVPAVGPVLLALATFIVITVVPGYLIAAAKDLRGTADGSGGKLTDGYATDGLAGTIVAVTVAAAGLALLVSAPTVLFVLAGVLAAGAVGASIPNAVPGRQTTASVIGVLAGLGVASIWGTYEVFSLSWPTVIAAVVALVIASVVSRVSIGNERDPKGSSPSIAAGTGPFHPD